MSGKKDLKFALKMQEFCTFVPDTVLMQNLRLQKPHPTPILTWKQTRNAWNCVCYK